MELVAAWQGRVKKTCGASWKRAGRGFVLLLRSKSLKLNHIFRLWFILSRALLPTVTILRKKTRSENRDEGKDCLKGHYLQYSQKPKCTERRNYGLVGYECCEVRGIWVWILLSSYVICVTQDKLFNVSMFHCIMYLIEESVNIWSCWEDSSCKKLNLVTGKNKHWIYLGIIAIVLIIIIIISQHH